MSEMVPAGEDAADAPAAIRGEMQRVLAGYVAWAGREWRRTLRDIEKQQAGYVPPGEKRDDLAALREHTAFAIRAFERFGQGDPARLDHLTPADVTWFDITDAMARDEAAGRALWRTVAHTARDELAAGALSGQAIEGYHPRPMDRAQYLALRQAVADGLQPRNGMEWLLVDGIAEAWAMHLRWLSEHNKLNSLESIRVERDVRQREGWEPPRLRDVEAIDRAALMADRFQRQFLRLMKSYRDGRRLIASMTVLGGQVNVAEQQIVAGGGDATAPDAQR